MSLIEKHDFTKRWTRPLCSPFLRRVRTLRPLCAAGTDTSEIDNNAVLCAHLPYSVELAGILGVLYALCLLLALRGSYLKPGIRDKPRNGSLQDSERGLWQPRSL